MGKGSWTPPTAILVLLGWPWHQIFKKFSRQIVWPELRTPGLGGGEQGILQGGDILDETSWLTTRQETGRMR